MRIDRIRATGLVLAGVCAGIALVICCDGGPGKTGADDGGMGDGGGMGGGPGLPTKVIVASEDVTQIETGMVLPHTLPCPFLVAGAMCGGVLDGPFVLTDVRAQRSDLQSTVIIFVAPGDAQVAMAAFKPRWQFGGPGNAGGVAAPVTGMRLLVKANEKLYFAIGSVDPTQGLLWSGYRPY